MSGPGRGARAIGRSDQWRSPAEHHLSSVEQNPRPRLDAGQLRGSPMSELDRRYLQELIIAELGVMPSFDAELELRRRIAFLTDQLKLSGATAYVLGISGGVDSTTAGRLCQLAVERVRADGGDATFIAMRLPYGAQNDEADAQRAL